MINFESFLCLEIAIDLSTWQVYRHAIRIIALPHLFNNKNIVCILNWREVWSLCNKFVIYISVCLTSSSCTNTGKNTNTLESSLSHSLVSINLSDLFQKSLVSELMMKTMKRSDTPSKILGYPWNIPSYFLHAY